MSKVWEIPDRPMKSLKLFCLLWTVMIVASCSQATIKLKQAQDLFNQASALAVFDERYGYRQGYLNDRPTGTFPLEEARSRYHLVLELLKYDILASNRLHPELRINAYTLKAVAEWQLKYYQDSIKTANKGQRLCASGTGKTPRDCGMLSIIEGLVVNSDTLDKFEARRKAKLNTNLTREEAVQFVEKLEFALEQLGDLDMTYGSDDPISIYANQQKLIVIGNILEMWHEYDTKKTEKERAQAKARAEEVCTKFPEEYALKDLTQELAINRVAIERCGE